MYGHVAVLAEVKLQGTQPQYHKLVYDIARYTSILIYNIYVFQFWSRLTLIKAFERLLTDYNYWKVKSFWHAKCSFKLCFAQFRWWPLPPPPPPSSWVACFCYIILLSSVLQYEFFIKRVDCLPVFCFATQAL